MRFVLHCTVLVLHELLLLLVLQLKNKSLEKFRFCFPSTHSLLSNHPISHDCPPLSHPQNMLKELLAKGPFSVGIFRKSANARVCKEFRAKLESDPNTDVSDVPVNVIASVFKEFLRSLPDCVLQSQLYGQWIDAINTTNNLERRQRIQRLLEALPEANRELLRYFLCALWHIAQKSSLNKMCSQNLGVCVGQSLLSPHAFASPNPSPPTSQRCEVSAGLAVTPPKRHPQSDRWTVE